MLYGYLAWYQSELGGTNLLIGVTVFVQACYVGQGADFCYS